MAASSLPPQALVGLWELQTIRAIHSDGTVVPDIWLSPVGYLSYTAQGHMLVMFGQRDRPLLSGNPTSPFSLESVPMAELAGAFTGFSAYAGTYTFQDNQVHHHLTTASLPNRVGTTLVRQVSLQGDRLTLRTPELMQEGAPLVYELVWQRLE